MKMRANKHKLFTPNTISTVSLISLSKHEDTQYHMTETTRRKWEYLVAFPFEFRWCFLSSYSIRENRFSRQIVANICKMEMGKDSLLSLNQIVQNIRGVRVFIYIKISYILKHLKVTPNKVVCLNFDGIVEKIWLQIDIVNILEYIIYEFIIIQKNKIFYF